MRARSARWLRLKPFVPYVTAAAAIGVAAVNYVAKRDTDRRLLELTEKHDETRAQREYEYEARRWLYEKFVATVTVHADSTPTNLPSEIHNEADAAGSSPLLHHGPVAFLTVCGWEETT